MGQVITKEELNLIRQNLRNQNQKVVFTNGVFDIIHRGHVEYLLQAKSLADILIVGLNSDSSVKRIKGDKRPIVTETDRAVVLANLVMVDYVCLFGEDTPLNLISEIIPDILVKGADWNLDNIVGREIVEKNGGKVVTMEFLENRSSTNIIETIIERYCRV
jgi:D-beta-D-heptose 7-phosphate kinase/D-beta-D-heptose 1-phosphate adenosyltransferase